MGLRSRIKEFIKDRVKGVKALAFLIHEEANYPGRPQPHMAARNPLWGGVEEEQSSKESDTATSSESHSSQSTSQNHSDLKESEGVAPLTEEPVKEEPVKEESERKQAEEEFWFLRGDNEGWSDLNPGKTKPKNQ